MKGEGDSAKLAVLLFLFLHNSQVLPRGETKTTADNRQQQAQQP